MTEIKEKIDNLKKDINETKSLIAIFTAIILIIIFSMIWYPMFFNQLLLSDLFFLILIILMYKTIGEWKEELINLESIYEEDGEK